MLSRKLQIFVPFHNDTNACVHTDLTKNLSPKFSSSPRCHENGAHEKDDKSRSIMELETDIVNGNNFPAELQMRCYRRESRYHFIHIFCPRFTRFKVIVLLNLQLFSHDTLTASLVTL